MSLFTLKGYAVCSCLQFSLTSSTIWTRQNHDTVPCNYYPPGYCTCLRWKGPPLCGKGRMFHMAVIFVTIYLISHRIKGIIHNKNVKINEIKGALSRYFEVFWPSTNLPLNWRKSENNVLQRWKNTKEIIINHKRIRIVKDGEDWHGLQTTKLKNLDKTFQTVKPWLCSFKDLL